MLSYICECGHAEDEHDPVTRECDICGCFYYEEDENEEED